MRNYLIYNAVPAYREEEQSLEAFLEMLARIGNDFLEQPVRQGYIVVPRGKGESIPSLPDGLLAVEAAAESGLVYQNDSALEKVIEGEKPLPSCRNRRRHRNGRELLEEGFLTVSFPEGKRVLLPRRKEGRSFSSLIEETGFSGKPKAVYVGYPSFRLLKAEELEEMPSPLSSFIRIISERECILDILYKMSLSFREETCGSCNFGHEGTAQIQMILHDLTQKKGKNSDPALLKRLCEVMVEQTVCEICPGMAITLLDAFEKFGEEIEAHILKKICKAGVCSRFLQVFILPEACTGCSDCLDVCEEEAILGKKRFIHVIDQSVCTRCGDCLNACEEGAIILAGGANKPRVPAKPIPCKR